MVTLRFSTGNQEGPEQIDASIRFLRGFCFATSGNLGAHLVNPHHAVTLSFDSMWDAQHALMSLTQLIEQIASSKDLSIRTDWPRIEINGITWEVSFEHGESH